MIYDPKAARRKTWLNMKKSLPRLAQRKGLSSSAVTFHSGLKQQAAGNAVNITRQSDVIAVKRVERRGLVMVVWR